LASVDENGHIRLWDLKLMKCIREIEIDQWFHAQVAEFDKAESVLVIGGWHGLIVQGIDRSRCYTKPTSYRGSIDHLKWAPGLRLVISATDYLGEEKPMVRFWNSETLEEVPVKFMKLNDLGKRQDLLDIAATPDGKLLLVVFGEKWAEEDRSCVCAVWDLETGNLTKAFDDFLEQVYYVWLSADGRFIFGDLDSKLLVRKLPALSEKCALQRYSHYTSSVLVNRAGSIAVVRDRYAIEAWDLTRGRKLWEYRNKGMVTCACLTPDECWAVSGSDDHEIRAWELTNGMLLRTLRGHTARVNQMIAYDSGARVISVSSDRSIRLWDLADGSEMARFTCDTAVSSCTLVPSEGTAAPLIVAGDAFGRLHFLRLEECK
jgi:WD40 repeat protein